MKNWKVTAGSAGFAFLLSLLIGVISGVSFGVAFFRAILGGIVFGSLAYGAIFLIRKYLPELGKTIAGEQDDVTTEGGVDIVIEDENPPSHPYAGTMDAVPSETGEKGESGSENESGETELSGSEDYDGSEEIPPAEEEEDSGTGFVEEVEELSDTVSKKASGEEEEVGELESVEEDENTTIDSLPDIDSLSDTFAVTGAGEEEGEDALTSSQTDSSIDSVDVAGERQDPRVIAKAVQTMMKKD